MPETKPEAWLRGSVPGFDPLVMPVVHSLIQAREDVETLAAAVPPDHFWLQPGGAASIGFHIRHLGGALDRLFTYARGEALNDDQKRFLRGEATPGASGAQLAAEAFETIDRALDYLRTVNGNDLLHARSVGRAALPATTLGLLFHAAEHCTRHAGQAITTAKILTAKS